LSTSGKRKQGVTDCSGTTSFGKYGIIKGSDYKKMQRSFEVWLAEIKGLDSSLPKWEIQKYFSNFVEDFNTATLPHIKYYNYDKWEMEEYQRQKQEAEKCSSSKSDMLKHEENIRRKALEKQQREWEMVRKGMSVEKVDQMKRQARLKAELVNAYKTGDEEKRKKLQRRLEPEK